MVKTVIIRKRTIFIYGLLVLVLAIGVVVLETFINKSNNDEYITYAQAAKMIAYANVDDAQAFETGEVWYKPYIEYVNINGYMQCEEPDDYIMMKDVYILSKKLNAGDTTFESVDALKAYAVNPKHVAVADGKVRPYTAIRSCLDYEV